MTRLATSWLVYRLTGSALLLGIVGFAGQIPTFLFAPFAGVWVDRLDRRQVLVVTQILAMLQSLALAVLTLTRHINIQGNHLAQRFPRLDQCLRHAWQASVPGADGGGQTGPGNAIALNSSMVNLARLWARRWRSGNCSVGRRLLLPDRWHQLLGRDRLAAGHAIGRPRPAPIRADARAVEGRLGATSPVSLRSALILLLFAIGEPDGLALHGADADFCRRKSCRAVRTRWAF